MNRSNHQKRIEEGIIAYYGMSSCELLQILSKELYGDESYNKKNQNINSIVSSAPELTTYNAVGLGTEDNLKKIWQK